MIKYDLRNEMCNMWKTIFNFTNLFTVFEIIKKKKKNTQNSLIWLGL